jgi:hypothetical protein
MLVSGLCQNNKIKIVRAASVKFNFFFPWFVFQMPKLQFYICYAIPNAPQHELIARIRDTYILSKCLTCFIMIMSQLILDIDRQTALTIISKEHPELETLQCSNRDKTISRLLKRQLYINQLQ